MTKSSNEDWHNNNNNNNSLSGTGGSYTYTYHKMKPTKAFECDGIEFWGSSKDELDGFSFKETDLIINCTGITYVPKPFIKEAPLWLNGLSSLNVKVNQLVLDWRDMAPPPDAVELDFWEDIILQCQANGIKRIFCCCSAGAGRTGTSLCSLAIASGKIEEPEDAIDLIRTEYYKGAVETQGQTLYVYSLIYDIDDLLTKEEDESSNKNSKGSGKGSVKGVRDDDLY